jgi:hypothetical protein
MKNASKVLEVSRLLNELVDGVLDTKVIGHLAPHRTKTTFGLFGYVVLSGWCTVAIL